MAKLRLTLAALCFTSAAVLAGVFVSDELRVTRAKPAAPGGLDITPASQDFGARSWQDTVEGRVWLANPGPGAVRIMSVLRSCSCSAAEVDPAEIPEGGRSELRVSWRLAGRRGRTSETVTLVYKPDGKPARTAEVALTAVVEPAISASVDRLTFCKGDRGTKSVSFTTRLAGGLSLTGVKTCHPAITAEVEGDSVVTSFDPQVSGWKATSLWIAVATNRPEEREVRIPVDVR